MQDDRLSNTLVVMEDMFSPNQCSKKDFEEKEMQKILYVSAVESLIYTQVCMRPNIAYVSGMLSIYLSNSEVDH